jgi:hypothetical protein
VVFCPSDRTSPLNYQDCYGNKGRLSYVTPGLSVVTVPTWSPYALARTRQWEGSVSGLPRAFSLDVNVATPLDNGVAGSGLAWFNRVPHKAGFMATGVNLVTVDGAGGWVGAGECRVNTVGNWMYYQQLAPRKYEILMGVHRTRGAMDVAAGWPYAQAIGSAPVDVLVNGSYVGTHKASQYGY